jgi:MipA family protein
MVDSFPSGPVQQAMTRSAPNLLLHKAHSTIMKTSFNCGMVLATILCVTMANNTAQAAENEGDKPSKDWTFMLGGGAMYAPDYEGSNDYKVLPIPIVEVSWRDRVRLTTKGGPGILVTPFATDAVKVDLGLRYDMGRKESSNDALKGLGNVDGGAVAVVRFGYEMGPVGFGLEVARDLGGDRDGLVATAEAEYSIRVFGDRTRLSVSPHITWADDHYMSSGFGITAAQSARSVRRLARYDAGAGFKDAGVAVGVGYALTDSIQAMSRLGYSRMLGDAADSPLVKQEGSADQFSALVGLSYRW